MAGDVRIRTLDGNDAAAVLDLWRVGEATPTQTDTLEDVNGMIGRQHVAFLVADLEGQLVGSIMASFDGWRGHLYRLVVHPEHRRKRIARNLVLNAERALSSWGAKRVTALVEKEHDWATAFWVAAGYVQDSRMIRFVRSL
jgi:ribosomal protein S18 acetylase RimI-like enzyme